MRYKHRRPCRGIKEVDVLSQSPSLEQHSPVVQVLFLLSSMFAKLFTLSALAILAVATPAPAADACDTGALQCCQSVQPAGSSAVAPILKSIGVVVQDLNVPVGVTCSPVSVVGVGSGSSW